MLGIFGTQPQNLKTELLSGLTVALALVPEAIAFAFIAGVSPVIGLYSAFFIGLICALIGGRPGMISGATGAMAVVVVGLVATHGIEYLFPAVILCGLIQMVIGFARLGVLIRMVPHSVMLGFVNGLAIVICMAQFGSFKTVNSIGTMEYMRGPSLWMMLGLVALTMAIIWLLPKLTRAVPASLAAILIVSGVGGAANLWLPQEMAAENQDRVVMTVGDMLATNAKVAAAQSVLASDSDAAVEQAGAHGGNVHHNDLTPEQIAAVSAAISSVDSDAIGISAGLPTLFFQTFTVPPMTLETLRIIFPFAAILAAVGVIESLMTLSLIDDITETQGSSNRECIGQGIANIVCGLFGGMGGCAMIGQSLINVESGGRGRTSGAFAACCLLAFVLFLAPWIEMIPMAALVGVMFMVVIGTFEWASLKLYRKIPLTDFLVMLIVTLYTAVMHDLASAVIIGVLVSSVAFTFKHAKNVNADIRYDEHGAKIYQLHGPLFFASTSQFKEMFDPSGDPDVIVIDFYYTRVYDHSGMEAIHSVASKYQQVGKAVHLTHLSDKCREMIRNAADLVDVPLSHEPQFHVSTDRFENNEVRDDESFAQSVAHPQNVG
ncbi:C4-dicarboxylic acid transporter DauA [Maioricimonas rarisocia]|uniref:C4-dicarboxylic acid transporter DauA n=1 Tax=Maioricimonas rarisocia TaxID=2528026 RepID=A0A517Z035_9PLAN|nr:SulP family inorganic anion transporter [Maioricimonas rarisocia]QDU35857.1 C4-dicarboxylic acid transporter DauA [Maioricimonas rarisocia]